MNKYLLDTHILLWWVNGDESLSPKVREIIENEENEIYISVVSAWEIILKLQTKKLKIKLPIERYFEQDGFEILPFQFIHVMTAKKLEQIHKDPFDRMLICQAKSEKLTLITSDQKIWKYRFKIFKA